MNYDLLLRISNMTALWNLLWIPSASLLGLKVGFFFFFPLIKEYGILQFSKAE